MKQENRPHIYQGSDEMIYKKTKQKNRPPVHNPPVRVCVVALTKKGAELAVKLGKRTKGDIYIKNEFIQNFNYDKLLPIDENFTSFVGRVFKSYDIFIFIMACGIVVRSIAPYIEDKKTDPGVLVMDEKGEFVISLLSGHIGGANEMACKISSITGSVPVITTATDVNNTVSFDVFAKKNDCIIENMEYLKYISSRLVNDHKVFLYSDYNIKGVIPDNLVKTEKLNDEGHFVIISNRTDIKVENALYIRPLNLVVGIGCKKGTSKEDIENALKDFMEKNNRSMEAIKSLATIELKKDEPGLLEFCKDKKIPLCIVPIDSIKEVEREFTPSAFVKEKTGVLSVAEPCAVLAKENTKLICKKTVYKGITLALGEVDMEFNI